MTVPDKPCICAVSVVVTIVDPEGAAGMSEGAAAYIATRPMSKPITKVPIAIPIGFFLVSDIEIR